MFAAAAREAVFSNPDVIRRINADFIPVALKAGLVNNPGEDEEGRLCQEIGRSKPAPQGICVANSAGKALDWTLMFDDSKSVLAFLDHTHQRYAKFPDAAQPIPTERYMRFPSSRLDDAQDSGVVLPITDHHTAGNRCPAKALVPPGTLTARVFGRALGADGKPMTDTARQEHYVEDRFAVSTELQGAVAKVMANAGTARFALPDSLARLLISHAFLGQLDVNPLGSPAGGRGNLKQCAFQAQKMTAKEKTPIWLHLTGQSEIAGGQDSPLTMPGSDGRLWRHDVSLTWEGFIEIRENRMTRLLLSASGSEKLQWGNAASGAFPPGDNDVAHLPAGHIINLACPVRYGILAEPAPPDEVSAAAEQRSSEGNFVAQPPNAAEQARARLQLLGPPFCIFLPPVQSDLKLTLNQKQRLEQQQTEALQGLQQFEQEAAQAPPEDRETRIRAYQEAASRKQKALLATLLQPEQRNRLSQIMLQQEGFFTLGHPERAEELRLDEGQRQHLMAVFQEMQNRFQAAQQNTQRSGRPDEMQQQARTIRSEEEAKIEAILTPAQKRQWQTMIGKPLKL